ncbi:MAG: DUF29 domain-containing protein [Symploca sp. SIO1B1]|nr:DUF29 domain-containing protein [Symploca sp. SIO1B1]
MTNLAKPTLKRLYETDEYLWLEATISLLKANRLEELDLEHLIEELESLGKRDLNKVRSILRKIIVHLLLLEYWQEEQERNGRHWQSEITAFRADLRDALTTSLENKLKESLESIYRTALKIVLQKTGLSSNTIPDHCPYSFEQLLDDDWYPV